MATRVVYGLGLLAAIITALAPLQGAANAFMLFAIVVLGGAYVVLNIDCKAPQAFIATALAVYFASNIDILIHIYAIGEYLDAILDKVMLMYVAGGATVFGVRAYNIVVGDGV